MCSQTYALSPQSFFPFSFLQNRYVKVEQVQLYTSHTYSSLYMEYVHMLIGGRFFSSRELRMSM